MKPFQVKYLKKSMREMINKKKPPKCKHNSTEHNNAFLRRIILDAFCKTLTTKILNRHFR